MGKQKKKRKKKEKKKTKWKQNEKQNKTKQNLPTSWLFADGRSFLSAAKHGAKFKSNWQCYAAMHASIMVLRSGIYCGWLALTVTESRSVQLYNHTKLHELRMV